MQVYPEQARPACIYACLLSSKPLRKKERKVPWFHSWESKNLGISVDVETALDIAGPRCQMIPFLMLSQMSAWV